MNFKQYRIDKGLTQDQAADLIGMSGSYWSTLEAGQQPQDKVRAFARVLTHLDHPDIDKPLDFGGMASVIAHSLSFKEASALIGAGDSTWSSLANGHLPAKRRWIRSVNALLIELAESKRPALDLTPSGDIEIVQPVLTPTDESDRVEEEISDQSLIPFNYNNHPLRCKSQNQDAYICIRDICAIIGLKNSRDAISLIDEEEVVISDTLTSGGIQKMSFTTYPGMLQLLTRTRVEGAKPFQNWVYKEVLPTVMKTGQYQAQNIQINDPLSQAIMIGQALQTFGKEIQAMQARELVREQKIANLEQAAQQVKYLEIAKTDRSEVLEIVQSELIESKTKEKIEQLNHYRQRKDLEKRVAEVAWLAIKAHGGDHGEIIKGINKRIRAGLKGAHGYVVGREHYQAQDFAMAYQIVAMVEKEIGDFPKQGEIDFGKDK